MSVNKKFVWLNHLCKGDFGKMASLKGKDIVAVSLEEATDELKTVDDELYEVAKTFFG